jgi:hypothetical protein
MTDEEAKQLKSDMDLLNQRPEWRRFLWRVIQSAGIFTRTTDGSVGRSLDYFEGRRNLGLDILDMAERGQPIPETHPDGPLFTLIQTLREETSKPTEKPNAKRRSSEFNRHDDADDDPDAG